MSYAWTAWSDAWAAATCYDAMQVAILNVLDEYGDGADAVKEVALVLHRHTAAQVNYDYLKHFSSA